MALKLSTPQTKVRSAVDFPLRMLTENLVASVLAREGNANAPTSKNASIHFYDLKPRVAVRSAFNRSSTQANCLAVGSSHIYAAQADKAVVHVYSREKNNQEAVVPFPERIHSVALSDEAEGAATLILGTEGGRLILWELSTGRSISTSASHLQPITSLVCDPNSNFILSGAADSNVHVWSLPNILSFHLLQSSDLGGTSALTPLRTLSNHRAPVTCIAVGHSKYKCNIAISASRDNKALIWEYRSGTLLRTILLPSTPLCLTLDPADRALHIGYEDGTLHSVDFYSAPSLGNPLHDAKAQNISLQLNESGRWLSPIADIGSTNCIATTYDGTSFLSGHACGKVLSWDVAKRKYVSEVLDLASPVTNIRILYPSGFLSDTEPLNTTLHTTVKARYDHMLSGGAQQNGYTIPPSYILTAQFSSRIAIPNLTASSSPSSSITDTSSQAEVTHSSFPDSLIAEGLSELSAWNKKPNNEHSEDMIMLESPAEDSALAKLTNENALLQEKIENYQAERKRTWSHLMELNTVNFDFRQREARRQRRSRRRKEARLVQEENERGEWLKRNGIEGEDEDKGDKDKDVEVGAEATDSDDDEGLDDSAESSSADEMTQSE